MKNNVAMGVLAYLGPLVIISYLTAKDDPFVNFHIKQGLVLLVIDIILWFGGMFGSPLIYITGLLNLVVFILAIIGIVNVVQGQQKELPFVGTFARRFNI